jgi:hypothetical protein
VSDAPPIVSGRGVLLAMQLVSRKHVPQPELRLQAAVALGDATRYQRLRVDGAPIGKARQSVDGAQPFDKGAWVDGSK